MDLLEAGERRLDDRFRAMVESVRIGTVIAHDKQAFNSWKTANARITAKHTGPMSEGVLLSAIHRIGEMFPGRVIHELKAA